MSLTPPTDPSYARPEPGEQRFEFHRLLRRDPRYRWWRPLAFAATGLGFFTILSILVVILSVLMMMFNPAFWTEDLAAFDNLEAMNMSDPMVFVILMISLIVMIPAVWFAYLLLGGRPVGLLVSVAGKVRWRWLGLTLAVSTVVYAAYFAVNFLLDALGVVSADPVPASSIPADPLFFALLVLLLTPFQCAAEELVFRGALMQVIGSWLKHPAFAILLPVPLFTFGHIYDIYGLLDVAVFAIAAGYLSWRTGGLEAAIAVHIVNNTLLFLLGAAGLADLNASESNPVSLIFSVALTGILTFVLLALAKRRGIERTAGPVPPRPEPQLLQPWPMAYPVPRPNLPWQPQQDPRPTHAEYPGGPSSDPEATVREPENPYGTPDR